jgi:hypothetical protein
MKKLFTNSWLSFIICVLLIVFVSMATQESKACHKTEGLDVSAIEQGWCGGFEDGTVRMVGAWWYADGVVEDEQGQLWYVEQSVTEEDFLFLWIADNHTPNDVEDDVIIKVWREAM